jgi:cytochrome b
LQTPRSDLSIQTPIDQSLALMQNTKRKQQNTARFPRLVRVWDLPTRLFHWLLVIFVITSFTTGHIGGNAMQYHKWSGFTILSLILFRLIWGFVGSRESRFMTFVKGPSAVAHYAMTLPRKAATHYRGHNPLGGWSIIAMLFALLVQAATGLFANDDIATEGPLYKWVSKATSDALTRVHRLNREVIIVLVSIHVLAVFFYFFYKRENLVKPMITGMKRWNGTEPDPAIGRTSIAAAIAGLAGLAVYFLVR